MKPASVYKEQEALLSRSTNYSVDHENQTSQWKYTQNGVGNRKPQGNIFCPKHSPDKGLHAGALASRGTTWHHVTWDWQLPEAHSGLAQHATPW